MARKLPDTGLQNLPACAADFIKLVIKKMRYRRKVRAEVMAELTAHFEDELKDCTTDEQRQQKAERLIAEFGDAKLLAVLLRRAKKRCRPPWQKCLIQTSKVIGFVVLYVIVRVIFLTTGTPHININYIDWLNKLVAAQELEAKNAKIDYDRAAELSPKIPSVIEKKIFINHWFNDFSDSEKEHLVEWLNDNQKSFEALKQGAQKAYYWPVYENQKSGPIIQSDLVLDATKPLSKCLSVARAMGWQIIYDAYRGKLRDAMDNCLVLQKFAMHLQGKGFLVEQIIGIAIEALAHQRTFMLLEKQDVPVEVLKDFYNKFENNLSNTKPTIDLEAEKAFLYDLIQRGFTDDGKGNGRVLKDGLPLAIKDALSSLAEFFFWNYPDRRQVTTTIDKYFEQAAELINETPYQLHVNGKSHLWDKIASEYFMLRLLGPAHQRISDKSWRLKTERAGLLTVIAILLYQKEKGGYPAGLDELIATGYLKELPMDPYSDKPLVYHGTDEGFTLYSVGENFRDDDGTVARRDDGRIKSWADDGDWVFWPVPQN